MVSSIGYKLNNPTLISGFGYRHRVVGSHMRAKASIHHAGRGVGRRAVGSVISTVGHALVNKLASAISGSGYKRKRVSHRRTGYGWKVTGAGRPRSTVHRKPRLLIGGIRRKHRTHKKNSSSTFIFNVNFKI